MTSLRKKQSNLDFSVFPFGDNLLRDGYFEWSDVFGITSILNGLVNNTHCQLPDTIYLIEQASDYSEMSDCYVWNSIKCYKLHCEGYSGIRVSSYKKHILDTALFNSNDPDYLIKLVTEIDPVDRTLEFIERWNTDSIRHHECFLGYSTCTYPEQYIVSRIIVKNKSDTDIETYPMCPVNWHPDKDVYWLMEQENKAFEKYKRGGKA